MHVIAQLTFFSSNLSMQVCDVLTKAGPGKVWVDQTFLGIDLSQFFQRGIIKHLRGGANTYKDVYWFCISQNKKTNILIYKRVLLLIFKSKFKKTTIVKKLNW